MHSLPYKLSSLEYLSTNGDLTPFEKGFITGILEHYRALQDISAEQMATIDLIFSKHFLEGQ